MVVAADEGERYALCQNVWVFSLSSGQWSKGVVHNLDLVIHYVSPEGTLIKKALPAGHKQLRPIGKGSVASAPRAFGIGDQVQVWSTSTRKWLDGQVVDVQVTVLYAALDGCHVTKVLAAGHRHLRKRETAVEPTDPESWGFGEWLFSMFGVSCCTSRSNGRTDDPTETKPLPLTPPASRSQTPLPSVRRLTGTNSSQTNSTTSLVGTQETIAYPWSSRSRPAPDTCEQADPDQIVGVH